MINRINLILKAKNITAKQFAEEIGIQQSGLSHILGGRNNPSLDFVTKVIRRYPEIDANWLLLGRGEMYAAASGQSVIPAQQPMEQTAVVESVVSPTLFDSTPEVVADVEEAAIQPIEPVEKADESNVVEPVVKIKTPEKEVTMSLEKGEEPVVQDAPAGSSVELLLFIYSDGTFREYRPRR